MGKRIHRRLRKPLHSIFIAAGVTVTACGIGFFILGAGFVTALAWGNSLTGALTAATSGAGSPSTAAAALTPPDVSAKTAIVIEKESGKVLYEKKADERVFPASTTKIMTALLAIENSDLNQMVKVTDAAVGVEGSSIYLEKGEELPLRDLVYGLMLRSGNDAAVAIACQVGGDVDGFVDMMNERAQEIGAVNTHFMNPNGLHDEQHYTTARDMALIGRKAMHNPAFVQVAGTKTYKADRGAGKYNYFYNKNKVIYQYEGGTGIKIGYTKVAGRTLVASSKRGDMELICVVMGAPDWFNDTYQLMDYAYSKYQQVEITAAEQELKAVRVRGGDKDHVQVGSRESVTCPVIRGTEGKITVEYLLDDSVKAPVSRWQQAGMMKVYEDGTFVYSVPLYYLEDIEKQ